MSNHSCKAIALGVVVWLFTATVSVIAQIEVRSFRIDDLPCAVCRSHDASVLARPITASDNSGPSGSILDAATEMQDALLTFTSFDGLIRISDEPRSIIFVSSGIPVIALSAAELNDFGRSNRRAYLYLVAHLMGHCLLSPSLEGRARISNDVKPWVSSEEDADFFAGIALRSLGISEAEAIEAQSDFYKSRTSQSPAERSVAAFVSGYSFSRLSADVDQVRIEREARAAKGEPGVAEQDPLQAFIESFCKGPETLIYNTLLGTSGGTETHAMYLFGIKWTRLTRIRMDCRSSAFASRFAFPNAISTFLVLPLYPDGERSYAFYPPGTESESVPIPTPSPLIEALLSFHVSDSYRPTTDTIAAVSAAGRSIEGCLLERVQ